MTSQVYAEVNTSSTIVTNMVQWDGVQPFNVAPSILVNATGQPNAQIGGTYSGGVFTPPAAPAAQNGVTWVNSPTSNSSVPLPNPPAGAPGVPQTLYAILEPASAISSVSLVMPTGPVNDGTVVTMYSTKTITSLSLTGATVNNAPSTLTSLTQYNIIWSQPNNVWFHLGPSA